MFWVYAYEASSPIALSIILVGSLAFLVKSLHILWLAVTYSPIASTRHVRQKYEVSSNKEVCTDPEQKFIYDLDAAPKGQKLQLLTSGGIAIYGNMPPVVGGKSYGIWAWHPLPVRDRLEEKKRGLK